MFDLWKDVASPESVEKPTLWVSFDASYTLVPDDSTHVLTPQLPASPWGRRGEW